MKKLIGPNDSRVPMLDRSIERAQSRLDADNKAMAIVNGAEAAGAVVKSWLHLRKLMQQANALTSNSDDFTCTRRSDAKTR